MTGRLPSFILVNGRFVPEEEAGINPSDRGFLLGDGVFDTMAAIGGRLIRSREHIERLGRHAAILGISLPMDVQQIERAAIELVERNGLADRHAAIRTTITRGQGPRGLLPPDKGTPLIIITASDFDPAAFQAPVSAIIAQTVRRNEGSPLSCIKSLNYGDNILARREAQEKGAGEALLRNNAGNIVCGTVANLFIAEGERLVTPPLRDGALEGTTRALLIERAETREESIAPERLWAADSVFLTNSLTGPRPVQRIDGKPLALNEQLRGYLKEITGCI